MKLGGPSYKRSVEKVPSDPNRSSIRSIKTDKELTIRYNAKTANNANWIEKVKHLQSTSNVINQWSNEDNGFIDKNAYMDNCSLTTKSKARSRKVSNKSGDECINEGQMMEEVEPTCTPESATKVVQNKVEKRKFREYMTEFEAVFIVILIFLYTVIMLFFRTHPEASHSENEESPEQRATGKARLEESQQVSRLVYTLSLAVLIVLLVNVVLLKLLALDYPVSTLIRNTYEHIIFKIAQGIESFTKSVLKRYYKIRYRDQQNYGGKIKLWRPLVKSNLSNKCEGLSCEKGKHTRPSLKEGLRLQSVNDSVINMPGAIREFTNLNNRIMDEVEEKEKLENILNEDNCQNVTFKTSKPTTENTLEIKGPTNPLKGLNISQRRTADFNRRLSSQALEEMSTAQERKKIMQRNNKYCVENYSHIRRGSVITWFGKSQCREVQKAQLSQSMSNSSSLRGSGRDDTCRGSNHNHQDSRQQTLGALGFAKTFAMPHINLRKSKNFTRNNRKRISQISQKGSGTPHMGSDRSGLNENLENSNSRVRPFSFSLSKGNDSSFTLANSQSMDTTNMFDHHTGTFEKLDKLDKELPSIRVSPTDLDFLDENTCIDNSEVRSRKCLKLPTSRRITQFPRTEETNTNSSLDCGSGSNYELATSCGCVSNDRLSTLL